MHKSRGFTLIELLVVICIICILAAIALPAVNKVRQTTFEIRCMTNLKQITAAALSYAADNGGQLPFCNWGDPGNGGVYGHGWLYSQTAYRTNYPASWGVNGGWGTPMPANGVMTGMLWPYLNTLTVYRCPLDQPEYFAGTNFLTAYLCNGAQCGYGYSGMSVNGNPPQNLGAQLRLFKTPAASVYFWESLEQHGYENGTISGVIWNDGASYPWEEYLADRHYKGANVSCYDGHVEWWDPGTWIPNAYPTAQFSPTGATRLWCSPYPPYNGH